MATQPTTSATQDRKSARRSLAVVPFEDHMLEQVFDLYTTVFGEAAADGYRKRWEWSQKANLFPELTKRWVLLTADDEVKGFLATIPFAYEIGGKTEIAHTTCDFMVHPDTRFHGIKLMKQFFKECENCVSADDVEATIEITKWMGAQDIGGMASYTRPLDARAMQRGPLRRVPTPFFLPANPLLKVYDRFRIPSLKDAPAVQAASEFDERFQRLFERQASSSRVSLVRDLKYFNWRYGPGSPQSKREIGIVSGEDSKLEGFVVFQRSMRADTSRRGHIYELHATGERSDLTAAALIDYASDRLRKSGVWFVTYRQVPTAYSISPEVLKSRGFIEGSKHRMLVRLRDDESLKPAYEAANWCYMYGDSEASHGVS